MKQLQNQARSLVISLALLFLLGGCGDSQNFVATGARGQASVSGTLRVNLDVAPVNAQIVSDAVTFDVTLYGEDLQVVRTFQDSAQRAYEFTDLAPGTYLVRLEAFDAAGNRLGYFDRVVIFDGNSQTIVFDTLRYGRTAPPAPRFPKPGDPDFLAFASIPNSLTSGQAFSLNVLVFNADGTRDQLATGTVTLTALAGNLQPAPATAPLVNGSATLSGLVATAAAGQTFAQFRASSPGYESADTPEIDLLTAPVPRLAVASAPTTGMVAQPFTIAIELLSANGQRDQSANSNVTLALTTGPNGGVLSGTTTVAAVNGLATFSNLTVNTAGTYTFTASSAGFSSVTTGPINMVADERALNFVSVPVNSTASVGVPFTVQVEALRQGQRTNDPVAITVTIASGPPGAVLGGTTTVTTVNGLATFSELTLDQPGTYTLSAAAPTYAGAVSLPFVVTFPVAADYLMVVGHFSRDPAFAAAQLGIFAYNQLSVGANDVTPLALFGSATVGNYDLESNSTGSEIWVTAVQSPTILLYGRNLTNGNPAAPPVKSFNSGAGREFYSIAYAPTANILAADLFDVPSGNSEVLVFRNATTTATDATAVRITGLSNFNDGDGDLFDAYVYGVAVDETRNFLYVAQSQIDATSTQISLRILRFNLAALPADGTIMNYLDPSIAPFQLDVTTSNVLTNNLDYVATGDRLYITSQGGLQFLNNASTLAFVASAATPPAPGATTATLTSVATPLTDSWDIAYDAATDRLFVTDLEEYRVGIYEGARNWTGSLVAEPVRSLGNKTSVRTDIIQATGILVFPR